MKLTRRNFIGGVTAIIASISTVLKANTKIENISKNNIPKTFYHYQGGIVSNSAIIPNSIIGCAGETILPGTLLEIRSDGKVYRHCYTKPNRNNLMLKSKGNYQCFISDREITINNRTWEKCSNHTHDLSLSNEKYKHSHALYEEDNQKEVK